MNGDGVLDIVAPLSGGIGVLCGNGDGTFKAMQTWGGYANSYNATIADVNLDGIPDIVTNDEFFGRASILIGNGDGTFQSPQTIGMPSSAWGAPVIADVNGDGRPDLITQAISIHARSWWRLLVMATSLDRLRMSGAIPTLPVVTGTADVDQIVVVRDLDGAHIDWTMGSASGRMLIQRSRRPQRSTAGDRTTRSFSTTPMAIPSPRTYI